MDGAMLLALRQVEKRAVRAPRQAWKEHETFLANDVPKDFRRKIF
jgi:hypothetical protein